ncbi:MAG TPA: hypothetical protein VF109_11620 [Mycobacteriales bacterium]
MRRPGPARALPRVALATCRDLPAGDEDSAVLLAACASVGLDAEWRVWDDTAVDWSSYDLVVIRSTWDYVPRRDDFAAWATSVPRLANPAEVVDWNTDKVYLRGLGAAGVPVVPTRWLEPGAGVPDDLFEGTAEIVVKPTISAGGRDTGRYGTVDAARAAGHADQLLAAGRRVMVQPYLSGIDEVGETAVMHVGGAYSHTVGKGALLRPGDAGAVEGLWRPEEISPREPTDLERELAALALAAVPGGADRLLYGRVDLLPGMDGEPVVIEVEVTEPSLFLTTVPAAADRLAAAIRAAIPGSRTRPGR